MTKQDLIRPLLQDAIELEQIDGDIFSVIAKQDQVQHYDKTAMMYDLVVGNRFYNRIIWGNWPGNYDAFCRRALASRDDGMVLDAGCGSLVFTAKAYAQATRPTILMDYSLGMLTRARDRLVKYAGKAPDSIVLLQADIFNLPFRENTFSTVQSFGVMHLFDNTAPLIRELLRVKSDAGSIFLSGLAANNGLAAWYLGQLKKHKEIALALPTADLHHRLTSIGQFEVSSIGNMAYFSQET